MTSDGLSPLLNSSKNRPHLSSWVRHSCIAESSKYSGPSARHYSVTVLGYFFNKRYDKGARKPYAYALLRVGEEANVAYDPGFQDCIPGY